MAYVSLRTLLHLGPQASDVNATTNGMALDDDAAAGQPLPATLGHFGRLAAAAAAAEQEHRKEDNGGSAKEVIPRGESPEPLRVRSPGSLREPSRSPPPPPQGAASEGERRFSHEPWNWKLGGAPGEEEEAKSADEGGRLDRGAEGPDAAAQDKMDHRGPQEQKMSESLVA